MKVHENGVSPFAIQEISLKRVCRCSEWRVGVWFLSATQGILSGKVCRCMKVHENGVSPFRDTGNFSENGVSRRVQGREGLRAGLR